MTSPTPVLALATPHRTVPYVTVPMFNDHARRGIQIDQLTARGTNADNMAALAEYILQGSSWVDDHLGLDGQSLAAAQVTITGQATVDHDGYVTITPKVKPVIAVVSASFGTPGALTPLTTLQGSDVQPTKIRIPVSPFAASYWSGPIQLGSPPVGRRVSYAVTIVAGFPVTTLTADVAAGATTVPVAETAGIIPGVTLLRVRAGRAATSFMASAVSTASGPGTLTTPAIPFDLKNDSRYPTQLDGLPDSIINATVLATRGIAKQPGGGNISANTRQKTTNASAADDFQQAWEFLRSFMVLNA